VRQVFTSPRLENVERVAKMLEDEGIEVRITNGRSYKGNVRANFSYRDSGSAPQPALWIIKSEDQPRARAMLRELGLMDSSRNAPDSFLAISFRGADPYAATPAQKRSFRYKVGLLLVICVVLAMALMHGARLEKGPVAVAPRSAAPPKAPATIAMTPVPETVIADPGAATAATPINPVAATPAALAEQAFTGGLDAAGDGVLCLALDGKDAPAALIERLRRGGADVAAASQCTIPARTGEAGRHAVSGRNASFLEVGSFRPNTADGGDTGTVQRSAYGHGRAPIYETLAARRTDDGWEITGPAPAQAR
jgi:hypothetical protein